MRSPQQPIFEAAPIVVPPLEQIGREAVPHDGDVFDARLCKLLSDDEKAEVAKFWAAVEHQLQPEIERAREAWIADRIEQLVARGKSEDEARAVEELA